MYTGLQFICDSHCTVDILNILIPHERAITLVFAHR